MKKRYYVFIYIVLILIIGVYVSKWFGNKEPKINLLEYKAIDVVKQNNQVLLVAELNQHYYTIHRSFDNVIFKHYTDCPYCRKKFIPFSFSIYDGLNQYLRDKYKKLIE